MKQKLFITITSLCICLFMAIGLVGCGISQEDVDKAVNDAKEPLTTRIEELESTLTDKNAKIEDLEGQVGSLTAENQGLKDDATAQQAEKAALEEKINALKACVKGEHILESAEPCAEKLTCTACESVIDNPNPQPHDASAIAAEGKCVCGETFVATVGDTHYKTLEEAHAAWTSGTTLTLLSDVTGLSDYVNVTEKNVVLDLNGHTLHSSNTLCTIYINGSTKASLTIRDGKGGGQVDGEVYVVHGGASFVLESGTLKEVVANGDFTMKGGKIYTTDDMALFVNGSAANIELLGGEIVGKTGISVHSGTEVIIGGDVKITGLDTFAVDIWDKDTKVTIKDNPTLKGADSEIETRVAITFNTQPPEGKVWRIAYSKDLADGIFAIPADGFTLDPTRFASASTDFKISRNEAGSLVIS